jgi:tetratricopeptide (TPR) repeat protein
VAAAQAPGDFQFLSKGNQELEEGCLREAAEDFQKAVDANPSSARAHEGLGISLSRAIIGEVVRRAADSEAVERAEEHLARASDLSPNALTPVLALSQIEAALAERRNDLEEKIDRYTKAQV